MCIYPLHKEGEIKSMCCVLKIIVEIFEKEVSTNDSLKVNLNNRYQRN